LLVAIISDIHGNLPALEAVLDAINHQKIDQVICLGDICTLGPQPKEVIARLKVLDCPCIMGNHESALLNPEAAAKFQIAPLLIPTLNWCADQLDDQEQQYLNSFKPSLDLPLGENTSLFCYHGSPTSNVMNILSTTSVEELDRLFSDQTATVMAGGHTHIQMLRQHRGTYIINPGSVGCPFKNVPALDSIPTLLPWAEYALVQYEGHHFNIDMRRVSFDIQHFKEILSQSDLPIKDWWIQQYS
jgi:predicted phosphodiesterase